jgi:hypothetical protein
MMRTNISCIPFGCLVKPVAAAHGAHIVRAGCDARDEFDSISEYLSIARPQSRCPLEGPVDGNANFSATRHRCY